MKKTFVLLLCTLLFVAMTATAAFAAGLSLPEMSTCIDGVKLDQKSDNPPLYVYVFDDDDAVVDAMVGYMVVLDEYYGFSFDAMGIDEVSSDTFMYFYLPEYNGDASISPAYLDECAEPCYILFALTGSAQGYLLVVMPADGIDFNGKLPAAPVAATQPFATENGTRLMSPIEFSDGAVYCSSLLYFKNSPESGYHFRSTAGDYSHLTVAEDWMNALLNSGYYVLLREHSYKDFTWYNFEYVGSAYLTEYDGSYMRTIHNKTDLMVIVSSDKFSIEMNPSLDLIPKPVEQGYPSPDYDDGDDYDYDYDYDDDRREKCTICGGDGKRDCLTCGGSGYVGYGSDRHACTSFNCRGGDVDCWTCGGDGWK